MEINPYILEKIDEHNSEIQILLAKLFLDEAIKKYDNGEKNEM